MTTFWCTHSETSPEVDGSSVCLRCGEALAVVDIERDVLRAIEMVKRDYGVFGRHSMQCIEYNGEWCCAADCTIVK